MASLLPDYMVPAAYVCLSSLPLTLNGKVNRRALPAPDDEAFSRQQYEEPRGEMEEKLAAIWSELLGIERISRNDNFFALGGNSLLIVRMRLELRKAGLDTSVKKIFDAPTLLALADTLGKRQPVSIPTNLITEDTTKMTPDMLPLIDLSQEEIDFLVARVPGGIDNIQDIYGLTPLQEGILFHHMKAEHGDPYLFINLVKFVDKRALERYATALQYVIERHDILRTIFIWEGLSEPAQVVLRRVPSLLTEVPLGDTDEPVLEQLNSYYNPRHYKLDLKQAPLLRLITAPTSEGDWVVLQLFHHIISDHITLQQLNVEVQTIIERQNDQLATPTPFRHLVAQTRLGVSQAEHIQFFKKMLADVEAPTLPFGLNDVHDNGMELDVAHLDLPQELNNQLRLHARHWRVTLTSLCHLAWAQVVARASGSEKVVFGTVLLGRLQSGEGNDRAMGLLVNTLPLKVDIDGTTVEDAVRKTHARLSSLLEHEHATLALAQRCSGIPATLPLFSALMNCRHKSQTGQITVSIPGMSILGSERRTNYPLSLSVDDDDNSLSLTVKVVSSISAARVCGYMQQALVSLADALIYTPQQHIRTLTIMPQEEREMLLGSWNQMTVNFPPRRLHELFQAQVERDGQAIAVECEGETLTYAELNIQANRLAHYLIAKGVKPEDLIAICVRRSTKMIVALLGILKSGGAYLPLDPVYSGQRLTNILKDAEPLLLLVDATGRKALGEHQVSVIDVDNALFDNLPIDNPNSVKLGLKPVHLSHVVYTSGTTGTPKGVMVEHQQISRFFEVAHKKFGINKHDKWSLFHSISLSVSVWEIWGALFNGAQLAIVPYNTGRSPQEFYDWVCSREITVLVQPPSAFKMFMQAKNISSRSDLLRYVFIRGEELSPMIVKNWNENNANTQTVLINVYGTTETPSAIYKRIEVSKYLHTIGRPFSDLRVYLLDAKGELVPLGAEGELYIGGAGVTRGYLNRPELTAERFLTDPFSENQTARMYRTGDLARYLPDGNLVYLGRNDQQVKIRGFRIEPGEIGARLMEHPSVREAVIQPWKNETDSDTRLVAYVVADPDASLANNLRTYLASLLPDYMVPAAYVCLSSLPLTPNGKLDRRALPAPDDEAFSRQLYESLQGEMEGKVAAIWSELLGIERISRNDNFFELGGHSLLVMRFANLIKKHYDIRVSAQALFSFPILKDLAEKITNSSDNMYSDVAIPARRNGDQAPIFLLPSGDGDISHAFELAHEIDKNIPVYVLPWSSPEKVQPSSIEEMANKMIPLIKKVHPNGPCAVAGYSSGGILAYEVTNQLINIGYPVSFLGLIDTYPPYASISYNETDVFLLFITMKSPFFNSLNDSEWWERVFKLSLPEAIEEVKQKNVDLKNKDIDWEVLLLKQRIQYKTICEVYNINPISTTVNLYKATEFERSLIGNEFLEKKFEKYKEKFDIEEFFNRPKSGWEVYNLPSLHVIPVKGTHSTMMTDPTNRSLLGGMVTPRLT
ncbi:uncharacterized protein LOC116351985 [Contarinia nasturtii]|uniref:uncharacterized protein LOC116351985 n=1 Tax=Contarinia nasturtii TaxID=265458 RepID=UPI0012D3DA9F|nr:uncharacterized protein LOC116351985 [Contarinia nasturtii]